MKIKFIAANQSSGITDLKPAHAAKFVPGWFGKFPRFIDGDKKPKFNRGRLGNLTIKWCNPFLDSLSAGYIITLEEDLQVRMENGEVLFTWGRGQDTITLHDTKQIPIEMIPPGYSKTPFKFTNQWIIETPKGYSALFVHPLNRTDLPFHTLSGFVDTDDYPNAVHFPFVIREDFEGIIPAGTPIAQIIPIRRESWKHEHQQFNPDYRKKERARFDGTIYRAYKNLFWKRKDYR